MKLVLNPSNSSTSFYLPHHAVIKQTSSTTKLRVVFDGSAKSSTGVSLNDIQMVELVIQQDLLSIIIRFLTHKIASTADIAKMYRQILINKSQCFLQSIIWRENQNQNLQTFELLTVAYGTASASILAIRALHQLALEESENHPSSSKIAVCDFDVDDLLTGANTFEEAKMLKEDITNMLAKGGFELQKWSSNHPEIQNNSTSSKDDQRIDLNGDKNVNTLGLQWNTFDDSLRFFPSNFKKGSRNTKRIILSNIAQIFDPLGLIGPIITTAKLIMQLLWQLNITWDESVPTSIYSNWNQFIDQLNQLQQLSIPRWIIHSDDLKYIELHGFSDAREKAYGACIYIRSISNNSNHSCNLLCSKSRVAPLKNISLITFTWIKSTARNCKTFVANRVGEIQDLSNIDNWYHVSTIHNPSDIISRGAPLEFLINCTLWWNGPHWLKTYIRPYVKYSVNLNNEGDIPERRSTQVIAHLTFTCDDLFSKYSSLTKLLRITAWCLRFIQKIKSKMQKVDVIPQINYLTVNEINNACLHIVKIVQRTSFSRELHDLKSNGTVHLKSQLLSCNPFMDENGIIRVGGRFRIAKTPNSHKHQIILPKGHIFSKLIIEYEHKLHLHSGMQLTLAAVGKVYWILGARSTIRNILSKCVICFKSNSKSENYIMGNLPEHRVTPSRPFANSGIDYFGPLLVCEGKRRNSKTVKTYGAIFICFSTKAVHLELVSDLSTKAFLTALKRFMA